MADIQHIKCKNQRKTSPNRQNFALQQVIGVGESNEARGEDETTAGKSRAHTSNTSAALLAVPDALRSRYVLVLNASSSSSWEADGETTVFLE